MIALRGSEAWPTAVMRQCTGPVSRPGRQSPSSTATGWISRDELTNWRPFAAMRKLRLYTMYTLRYVQRHEPTAPVAAPHQRLDIMNEPYTTSACRHSDRIDKRFTINSILNALFSLKASSIYRFDLSCYRCILQRRCLDSLTQINCWNEDDSLFLDSDEQLFDRINSNSQHYSIYYTNIYQTVVIWTTVSAADTTTRHLYARLLQAHYRFL